jgi:DNA polymerase-3 subunit epsilon
MGSGGPAVRALRAVRAARQQRLVRAATAAGDLVVVDVETTGWQPGEAALTEVGAVRVRDGQVTAEFCELVNPGVPIPGRISELTGITDDMVRTAPGPGQVLRRFIDFAAGSVLAAHNAPFDVGFLRAACAQNGLAWPASRVVDTAVLARLVLRPGDVPDRKLATLAGHFGTATAPCHRALADARAAAEVLTGLAAVPRRRPRRLAGLLGRRVRFLPRWRRSHPGGGDGDGDRADQGGCRADPGDRLSDCSDSPGQRGVLGHR